MATDGNSDATVIVSTNLLREALNDHKAVADSSNGSVVTCFALDKYSHRKLRMVERQHLITQNMTASKNTQSLPGSILLYEGMPVILCMRNISTDLAITNSSQGIVQRIFTKNCPLGIAYASCVIVRFPDSKVQLTDLPKGCFPILPVTWSFTVQLKTEDGMKEKTCVTRYQLPIQPAFAVTGHSAQGKTLPKILVDLTEGGFAAYVAAS